MESTRDRIVREASRLFAQQGIKATTVAQIEVAVGLRKGSGGVHRHFASKDVLIEAVFAEQLKRGNHVYNNAVAIPVPDPADLRPYLTAIGTLILRDAEKSREVALIMLRDAAHLPEAVRRQQLANDEIAYKRMADTVDALISDRFPDLDANALAVLFVGSLIFFRLNDWLTGEPKLGLDDETMLGTWVSVFEPTFRRILTG
jgi:AcrR family transcriptional regulator